MEEVISKKEFDELIKMKGEVMGIAFVGDRFILKEEGEEGLKKLRDTLIGLGFPPEDAEDERVRMRKSYPMGWIAISLLAIKRLFDYDDKKFQEMGKFQVKFFPLVTRFFMKYFVSLERAAEEAPKIWRRYYTVGDFRVLESDKEKRYRISRLENFRLHPLSCQHLKGYLSGMIQMIVRSEVTCEETKCVHRGDEYHEFLFKW